MNAWDLPTSLTISGVVLNIRTDFRAILDILTAFGDPELDNEDKWQVALTIFYEDTDLINADNAEEAGKKMVEFIDMGEKSEKKHNLNLMDWEQDAHLIIPAINRVTGKEIRFLEYMHWWTFLGAYMEIGECAFATVVSIRSKKAKGKKLEKWERDFYNENKETVDLKRKLTDEEKAEEEAEKQLLDELFG